LAQLANPNAQTDAIIAGQKCLIFMFQLTSQRDFRELPVFSLAPRRYH